MHSLTAFIRVRSVKSSSLGTVYIAIVPSLRDSVIEMAADPALKCRATISRPCGAGVCAVPAVRIRTEIRRKSLRSAAHGGEIISHEFTQMNTDKAIQVNP